MRYKKYGFLSLPAFIIIGCGNGSTTTGTTFYSAGSDYNYTIQFESGSESNSASILSSLVINTTGSTSQPIPLISVSTNVYSFTSGNLSGLLYYNPSESSSIGLAFNGQGVSSYSDYATNAIINSVPNGTYNTICDINNISPCSIVINSSSISITEYSFAGQQVSLCSDSTINSASTASNPSNYSFICGTNGSTQNAGIWNLTPFSINGVTALMVSQYNSSISGNDDDTDSIAFPSSIPINPSGQYGYVYSVQSSQNPSSTSAGISSSSFTANSSLSIINNPTIGSCSGGGCTLNVNSYYNYPANGFGWFQLSNSQSGVTNTYNLVGNDQMGLYMDSYSGFYLP